jgi:hypothetical protein
MTGFTETFKLLRDMAADRDRAMFDVAARLSSTRDILTALIAEANAADMTAGSLVKK